MGYQVLTSAILILVFMTAVWLYSIYRKDMSIVDGFWGLGFMAVAHHWLFRLEEISPRQFVAFRIDWGEKTVWISFYKVFMLQGALMLVISLPIIGIMFSRDQTFSNINIIGVLLWLTGWLFETFADYQLLKFKRNPANKGKVMDSGLWRYSRHPNYFGETCVWWGVFLISLGSGYWYLSLLSPILLTYLLLKVSGVTMLEKRYDGNDKYAEYKRRTSSFFPLPRKK